MLAFYRGFSSQPVSSLEGLQNTAEPSLGEARLGLGRVYGLSDHNSWGILMLGTPFWVGLRGGGPTFFGTFTMFGHTFQLSGNLLGNEADCCYLVSRQRQPARLNRKSNYAILLNTCFLKRGCDLGGLEKGAERKLTSCGIL